MANINIQFKREAAGKYQARVDGALVATIERIAAPPRRFGVALSERGASDGVALWHAVMVNAEGEPLFALDFYGRQTISYDHAGLSSLKYAKRWVLRNLTERNPALAQALAAAAPA